MKQDLFDIYELWTCEGCVQNMNKQLSFEDQLQIFYETFATKHFPLKIIYQINKIDSAWLTLSEMFVMLYEFGGIHQVYFFCSKKMTCCKVFCDRSLINLEAWLFSQMQYEH